MNAPQSDYGVLSKAQGVILAANWTILWRVSGATHSGAVKDPLVRGGQSGTCSPPVPTPVPSPAGHVPRLQPGSQVTQAGGQGDGGRGTGLIVSGYGCSGAVKTPYPPPQAPLPPGLLHHGTVSGRSSKGGGRRGGRGGGGSSEPRSSPPVAVFAKLVEKRKRKK